MPEHIRRATRTRMQARARAGYLAERIGRGLLDARTGSGLLQREPVGSYVYEKFGLAHHVIVFVMRVTEVAEVFPENAVRERVWLTPVQAIRRIEDVGLRELIRAALTARTNGVTAKK